MVEDPAIRAKSRTVGDEIPFVHLVPDIIPIEPIERANRDRAVMVHRTRPNPPLGIDFCVVHAAVLEVRLGITDRLNYEGVERQLREAALKASDEALMVLALYYPANHLGHGPSR